MSHFLGLLRSDVPHNRHVGGKSVPSPAPARVNTPAFTGINTPSSSRGIGGIGLGRGKGKTAQRHLKVLKDTIEGVTRGDIRRLARRGGVKRISAAVYPDVREALKKRLEDVLHKVVAIVDGTGRKTVQTMDVVYALSMLGTPIYGFGESNRLMHK